MRISCTWNYTVHSIHYDVIIINENKNLIVFFIQFNSKENLIFNPASSFMHEKVNPKGHHC